MISNTVPHAEPLARVSPPSYYNARRYAIAAPHICGLSSKEALWVGSEVSVLPEPQNDEKQKRGARSSLVDLSLERRSALVRRGPMPGALLTGAAATVEPAAHAAQLQT